MYQTEQHGNRKRKSNVKKLPEADEEPEMMGANGASK